MLFGKFPGRGNDDKEMILDIKKNGIKYPHNYKLT